MIRTAILVALAGAFVGCGREEPPRFVPARPGDSAPARASSGGAIREATPPKNIATH